ncbi:P-loop NTPase [candidate division WOR-3 bacterium]|nr:P-loop NTPase [candidate division WOR-3 bacterium]
MMDPRLGIIDKRFENIKRLIAVSGGKGGIGKSCVASGLALALSKAGYKVGLLDLDFYGPSAHIILGIKDIYPKESKGIIPPKIHNIKFMSMVYYAGDKPSPLRGVDISNSIIELLTITRWGVLDFLIIDMPPGIGDATLDMIRLIKRIKFLTITTQSEIVLETVKKMLKILKELKIPIVGITENMRTTKSKLVKKQLEIFDIPFLKGIDFDPTLEDSIGNIDKLLKTNFIQDIKKIILTTPEFRLK